MICKICNQEFKNRCFLKKHLKKIHNETYKNYVITFDYNGIQPKCACGYGLDVGWYNDAIFYKLIKGHTTSEFRERQRHNRLGKITPESTKQKLRVILKDFYQTEEGIDVKNNRAENLRKFHSSEEGEIWAQKRSDSLKKFNQTEEGKTIRKNVAEKLTILYANNDELRTQISNSLKEYYKTAQSYYDECLEATSKGRIV